ncbi:hypothetical protein BC936DRAFT_143761, partial [Jimgerdemannia flammicorona]
MDKKAALIVRVLPTHLCRNHIVRNRIQRRCQRNGAQSRRSSQRDGRSYSILEAGRAKLVAQEGGRHLRAQAHCEKRTHPELGGAAAGSARETCYAKPEVSVVRDLPLLCLSRKFEAQLQAVRERLEQARSQKSQTAMQALNFGRIAKPLRGTAVVS